MRHGPTTTQSVNSRPYRSGEAPPQVIIMAVIISYSRHHATPLQASHHAFQQNSKVENQPQQSICLYVSTKILWGAACVSGRLGW